MILKEPYRNKMLNLWKELQSKDIVTRLMLYKLMSLEEKLDYNLIHDEIMMTLNPKYPLWITTGENVLETAVKEIKR